MGLVLNELATIMCPHGGRVVLIAKQTQVTAEAGAVVCAPDVVGALIAGCAQPATPSSKPCTAVVSLLPGATSPTVTVDGLPVCVDTLTGPTDGVPPAIVMVLDAGQASVLA